MAKKPVESETRSRDRTVSTNASVEVVPSGPRTTRVLSIRYRRTSAVRTGELSFALLMTPRNAPDGSWAADESARCALPGLAATIEATTAVIRVIA
jgi:hypothetical protein